MKKIILLGILVSMSLFVNAQTGTIFFKGTWREALKQSEKNNKLIFLDCYGLWCGPCIYMAKNVFPQKEVGDFFNAHFINFKVDVHTDSGLEIKKTYAVNFLPAFMLINSKGYKVSQLNGNQTADQLIVWAEKVMNSPSVMSLQERFDKGERNEKFMTEYITQLIKDRQIDLLDSIINLVVSEEGEDILYEKTYFNLLPVLALDSETVKFFTQNVDEYMKHYSRFDVLDMVSRIYASPRQIETLFNSIPPHKMNEEKYRTYIKNLESVNLPDPDFVIGEIQFYIACRDGAMDKAISIARLLLKDNQAWKFLRIAKIADIFFRTDDLRAIASEWADAAATNSLDLEQKAEALKIKNKLLKIN